MNNLENLSKILEILSYNILSQNRFTKNKKSRISK